MISYILITITPAFCLQSPPSTAASSRTKRLKVPDPETLESVQAMSSASEMPREERKRQYAALGRAVKSSCNPALIQKMKMCSDSERFFGILCKHIRYILPIIME